MGVDVLDILAVILGVLFTIRKLDAQRRAHKEFPHVDPKEFASWQSREVTVYTVGMFACFSKVLADQVFIRFLAEGLPATQVPRVGMLIDLSWILIMVVTFIRRAQMARLRTRLRIVLGGFVVEEKGSNLSQEFKDALRLLEEGQTDKARYQFKQISLDEDDSFQALAIYWLGECYLREGKVDEARDAFVESIDLDPTLAQPTDALARLDK